MTSIKADWREATLGAICTFKYGKALPQSNRSGGEFSVFGSNGVVGHHESAITTGRTIVIGRKGSHGEVNYSEMPCWPIDTAYFVDETATRQDIKWLAYRLAGLGLNQLNKAAAVPGLNREDAYRKCLLVPPVEEQRRIAAILDQADALRTKRREALAQLDSLTQSIFIEMFGDPARNPYKFPVHALGVICDVRDGTHDSPKYVTSGFPLVTTKNLRDGIINFADVNLISETDYAAINKRSKVDIGDLLMPMIGTIGSPILVCIEPNFAIKNMALVKFTQDSPHCQFILSFLKSDAFEKMVSNESKGGTQKFLSLGAIRGLQVPIPPAALQQIFATRIQAVESLKATHRAALQELDRLFASLQHRAFAGEL